LDIKGQERFLLLFRFEPPFLLSQPIISSLDQQVIPPFFMVIGVTVTTTTTTTIIIIIIIMTMQKFKLCRLA
jgi:hypothetical protein